MGLQGQQHRLLRGAWPATAGFWCEEWACRWHQIARTLKGPVGHGQSHGQGGQGLKPGLEPRSGRSGTEARLGATLRAVRALRALRD